MNARTPLQKKELKSWIRSFMHAVVAPLIEWLNKQSLNITRSSQIFKNANTNIEYWDNKMLCSENLLLMVLFCFQHYIFNWFFINYKSFLWEDCFKQFILLYILHCHSTIFWKIVCGKEFMSSYQPNYWILGRSQKMKFSTSKTTWILKQN